MMWGNYVRLDSMHLEFFLCNLLIVCFLVHVAIQILYWSEFTLKHTTKNTIKFIIAKATGLVK